MLCEEEPGSCVNLAMGQHGGHVESWPGKPKLKQFHRQNKMPIWVPQFLVDPLWQIKHFLVVLGSCQTTTGRKYLKNQSPFMKQWSKPNLYPVYASELSHRQIWHAAEPGKVIKNFSSPLLPLPHKHVFVKYPEKNPCMFRTLIY